MDLETLKIFMDVMVNRNFTDVAKLHGLASSSVSRVISSLEAELELRLFQRSTRKLEPTEAGVVYYEHIKSIVDDLESARLKALDLIEEPKGCLRVTAPVVYGQMYIVPILPTLAEKYPALKLELVLTDSYIDLIEDRIDIAVRLGTLNDSSYTARCINKMGFSICVSPEYIEKYGKPENPKSLEEHNCLLFPRQGHNLNWLFRGDQGEVSEIRIEGKYLITSSQAVRDSAVSGMGIALLPDWLIKNEIESGELVKLFDEYEVTASDFESAVWLLYPSREYLPLKTRVFIDHLLVECRANNSE